MRGGEGGGTPRRSSHSALASWLRPSARSATYVERVPPPSPHSRRWALFSRLMEVVGDVRHHDILPEEQRAFDQERRLVVQEVLPPVLGHELGNDDGDHVVVAEGEKMVEVLEKGLEERSIGRGEHDKRRAHAPLDPFLLQATRLVRIELDVDALDGGGQRPGVLQGVDDAAMDVTHEHEHGVLQGRRPFVAVEGELPGHIGVVALEKTRRSPREPNCRGRKPSRARKKDNRGKSAKAVLAASTRMSMVAPWMRK